MGAWGDGVFESDGALNTKDRILKQILFEFRASIDPQNFTWIGDLQEIRALAYIAWCIVSKIPGHSCYRTADARGWTEMAFSTIDRLIAETHAENQEETDRWRSMILEEFRRLEDAACDESNENGFFEECFQMGYEGTRDHPKPKPLQDAGGKRE